MRTIVIYPGRFQPFGPHHFLAYQQLCSKFGSGNVYIVTSNKTGIDSPLNFIEKRDIITQYGIPTNQVIQIVNPYKVSELSNLVNADVDSIVYAIGEKDKTRLDTNKPGAYFKAYVNGKLDPISKNGYVYIVPTVRKTIPGYGAMSGTTLRKFLVNCTAQQFKSVFGWFDQNVFSILKKRVGRISESITLPIEIGDVVMGGKFKNKKIVVKSIGKNEKGDITINGKPILRVRILPKIVDTPINENGATKHIQHPYNNVNLTFDELQQMIQSLLSGNSDITNVTEKIDGQSLSVTYKDGKFLAARNKKTILNPMSVFELEKILPSEVKQTFSSAFKFLTDKLGGLSDSLLTKFFKNGTIFLHIEIVNPASKNVIEYNAPYIIFLNMCEYDSEGEFIREMSATSKLFGLVVNDINSETEFNIVNSSAIKLPDNSKMTPKFSDKLKSISEQFKLSESDTLGKFLESAILKELPEVEKLSDQAKNGLLRRWVYSDKSIKLNNPMYSDNYANIRNYEDSIVPRIIKKYTSELEMLFLELGTELIPTIPNKLVGKSPNNTLIIKNAIKDSVKDTIKQIQQNGTSQQIEMLKIQWNKIKALGGIDKVCPCEGIVFTFKNNTYKLTGMFAPINQLLGITKYNS